MRQGLAAVSLLLVSISRAQDPCSSFTVAGLRPGMTPDEVGGTMHIEAATSQVTLADGTKVTVEEYPLPGGLVHVEYDGLADRRGAKVALVWQPLLLTFDSVTGLVKRFGEPASGKNALVRGLQPDAAVWILPKCDVVVTYYRRPEYWVGEDIATLLRVERISGLTAESPGIDGVAAWRASGAPPPQAETATDVAAAAAPAPAPAPRSAPASPKAAVASTRTPPAVKTTVPATSGTTGPQRTEYIQPIYPQRAKQQGVKGTVTLRIFVQKNGKVALARVADVDPPGNGFEQAAVAAAERWRFNPAMERGRPVEGIVDITVQFP
jgi:TonB family protein